MTKSAISRRWALGSGLAAAGALLLPRPSTAQSALPMTPDCGAAHEPTPAQTEGPYFTPDSPLRRDFVADGIDGRRISLIGFALDGDCRPIADALIDLWHADAAGAYDNDGYRLRGHQFTDAQGRYAFETIIPGLYPGRTRHLHLKVQAPGGRILTTQLYFPDEAGKARDRIFSPELLLALGETETGTTGRFDFVLDRG